jgi:hypothetical protein
MANNTMAKRKKDKQRSTKHAHKTVTRITLKTGCELMCSGRVSSSCSTSGTRRVNLVTNPLIPVFSVMRVTVLCACFVDRCLSFFLLAIVLSVLRFTDSDYPFGIFKLFFKRSKQKP